MRNSNPTSSLNVNYSNHNELKEDEIVENKVRFLINIGNNNSSVSSFYRPYGALSVNANDVKSIDNHNSCNKSIKEKFNKGNGGNILINDDHDNGNKVHDTKRVLRIFKIVLLLKFLYRS